MTHQKFNITGMHCGACATGITMIWGNIDGVSNVTVDLDAKTGELDFDETKMKVEDFDKAITDMGYHSSPV